MRKALDKIRRNWKAILVLAFILAIFAGFYFYIDWIWDTQGQNLALSQISLFIAIIVAIVALWSLKTTRDSLGLTRTTTRPFINLAGSSVWFVMGGYVDYSFEIENTGIYPADNVVVDIEFNKKIYESHISAAYKKIAHSIKITFGLIFPRDSRTERISFKLSDIDADKNDLDNRCIELILHIQYDNKLTNEKGLESEYIGQIIPALHVGEYKFEPTPDKYKWK